MNSKNNNNSKQTLLSQCTAVVSGINALSDATVLVDGQTMTKADAVAPLVAYPLAVKKTTDTHAAYSQAVLDERAAAKTARTRLRALKQFLRVRVGSTNPALESHGVPPGKAGPPPRTTAEKAASAAQAMATRAARHVMGPKQRKAVKTAPAQAPAATQPAAGQPSGGAPTPVTAPVTAPTNGSSKPSGS